MMQIIKCIYKFQKVITRNAFSILCYSCNVLVNIENGQRILLSCSKHSLFSYCKHFCAAKLRNLLAAKNNICLFPVLCLFDSNLQQVCYKLAAIYLHCSSIRAQLCYAYWNNLESHLIYFLIACVWTNIKHNKNIPVISSHLLSEETSKSSPLSCLHVVNYHQHRSGFIFTPW